MLFSDYENSDPLQKEMIGKPEHFFQILTLGLAEEAGEVCGKIKKLLRNENGVVTDKFLGDVKKELGDVLWYLTKLGHHYGITLEEVARANVEKLQQRMTNGTIKGEGDNR